MRIMPFKLPEEVDEVVREPVKNEWIMDAMPICPVVPAADRIAEYQEAAMALSVDRLQRNYVTPLFGFAEVQEYRCTLDVNQLSTVDINAYKKAYAMFSGTMWYLPEPTLAGQSWDLDAIVAPYGANDRDKIGSIMLIRSGMSMSKWYQYYPEVPDLDHFFVQYFNINTATLGTYVKPIIEGYMAADVQKKVVDDAVASGVLTATGDLVEDCFTLFMTNELKIPVNGGDVIAELDPADPLNPSGHEYRLSFFLLNGSSEALGISDDEFFSYRQRLPEFWDLQTTLLQSKSMAGHPLVHHITNKAVETARVDWVDQGQFKDKTTNQIELAPDTHPSVLIMQNPPSVGDLVEANANGINLATHGTSHVTVYNPDGQAIELVPDNPGVALSQTQLGAGDWQAVVTVTADPPLQNSATLDVRSVASQEVLHQLELVPLDFRSIPIAFWFLQPLNPADYNLQGIIDRVNLIYGKQANTFIYPGDSFGADPYAQVLTGNNAGQPDYVIPNDPNISINPDTPFFLSMINGIIALQPTTPFDINVIFTWELLRTTTDEEGDQGEADLAGICKYFDPSDNLQPYIAVEITDTDSNLVGNTVAHELGHWLRRAVLGDDASEEFDHIPFTHFDAHFFNNVMNPMRGSDHIQFTRTQAEMINQAAGQLPLP